MNFRICHMSPDSPTVAVPVITDLDYYNWVCDVSHFVNFGMSNMSPDSPT